MANYLIIGGDGKEYGPVTEADVRQWIAEGRLNGKSLAKSESDAEFRALETFPEFADVFAPPKLAEAAIPPLMQPEPPDARAVALAKVKSPAVGLMIAAILNLVFGLVGLVDTLLFPPSAKSLDKELQQLDKQLQQLNNPQLQDQFHALFEKWIHMASGPFGVITTVFGLVLSALILMGAFKMRSLRSYELCMTSAILVALPCLTPCCLVGLPLGIWALVVLRKPEVKSQFH